MRELTLKKLTSEMVDISDRGEYSSSRFHELLDALRRDLKYSHPAAEQDSRSLDTWWRVYQGLSTYIYR